MKKIRNILLICTLAFYNSCRQTEVETSIQTAMVDAEGAFSTWAALTETCPVCTTNPAAEIGVLAISATMGAYASSRSGRQSNENYINGKTININLPESNKLINNDFEEFGIKHNLALNYINSKGDFAAQQSKIKAYDKLEWVNVLKVVCPEKSTVEIEEIYNLAKDLNVIAKFNYSKYQSIKTMDDFNNQLQNSDFSAPMKSKLSGIFNEVEKLSHEPNLADLTISFINSEIQKILKSKEGYTNEERKVLILLSTYKHSLFYWNK